MSIFAVFGMMADVALAEARKTTPTTKPNPTHGRPPLDMSLSEWSQVVDEQAAKIMRNEKVRQLSQPFDAPQYAEQFIELARKS
ncbi:hypothetical protein HX866_07410 [Pseudomonas gingeri]|uniref:hypothetical protein n=1 Tax=Pseudomonas gingeri TaxID=117681 RepID=UPI0015A15E53|nr:hypothetical protein [Pseudomonas gingeri]NWA24716.1 hypothetical protein [Pseudomonas gingeri]